MHGVEMLLYFVHEVLVIILQALMEELVST